MEFKQAVVTQNGRALMAKLLAGKSTQFTKIKVSSTIYPDAQLANLTALTNIKQETTAQAYGNNTATVSVVGAIENTGLAAGYYINTVGLYAVDPDKGEILYSVSSASVNGYMPPDTGVSKSGFEFKIYTEVGNATKVDLTVDPAAFATHEDLKRMIPLKEVWSNNGSHKDKSVGKPNPNLILNSNDFTSLLPQAGAVADRTSGIIMNHWGGISATRIVTNGGSTVLKLSRTLVLGGESASDKKYTASIFIQNNSEKDIQINSNRGQTVDVPAGFSGLISFTALGGLSAQIQLQIRTLSPSENIDIHLALLKTEEGDKPTPWIPHANEAVQPKDLVAKWHGIAVFHSDNPDDYVWSMSDEYIDNLFATKAELNDLASRV